VGAGSRAGAARRQHANSVRLLLRGGPFERSTGRPGPPLPFLRLARRIRLEWAVDGIGIAIEDLLDAIGPVEVDRIENINAGIEDPIRCGHVPGVAGPSRG